MRLYLVRHGDPDYATDSLTAHGRAQAAALAEHLPAQVLSAGFGGAKPGARGEPFRVFCSPLGRAAETCAPFAERVGAEVHTREWLQELRWRVPLVDLFGDEAGPSAAAPPPSAPHAAGAADAGVTDEAVEKLRREKAGTMAVWDVPALLLRDPIVSAAPDAQWRLRFGPDGGGSSLGDFKDAFAGIASASDEFFKAEIGIARTGGSTYTVVDERFDPRGQVVVFGHNGLHLAWLAHLLGLPLAMVYSSFYLQPSSVTTIVFEERAPGSLAPRCISVGAVEHLAAAGLGTVASKYERVTRATPFHPRPSGIKANFW